VVFGAELGVQKCFEYFLGELQAEYLSPEANYIHVVVLDALVRRVRVVAK
jgi:hypothetical protein